MNESEKKQRVWGKVLFSALWGVFAMIMFCVHQVNMVLLFSSILLMASPWVIDFKKITSFYVDLEKRKVGFSQAVDEVKATGADIKRTADEVRVTADTFSKTVNSFLKFNMSALQREGRFDMSTSWEDAIKFLEEAELLSELIKNNDAETVNILLQSQCKVFELFEFDMRGHLPKEQQEIFENAISTGVYLDREYTKIYFRREQVAVDFDTMYSLKDYIKDDQKAVWIENIKKLEKYYKKYFD
jgi:hypothetical protein